MDFSPLLTEAAKLGFVVLLLVFAVVYFARRADKSAGENQERMARTLEISRADCVDRENKLATRLQSIEDRHHGESAETIRSATAALEMNAKTFEYLARRDSALDRTRP